LIVRAFMIRLSDDSFVAAMTIIIIFLPTSERLTMFYFPGKELRFAQRSGYRTARAKVKTYAAQTKLNG